MIFIQIAILVVLVLILLAILWTNHVLQCVINETWSVKRAIEDKDCS
jgi:hypothetical protein